VSVAIAVLGIFVLPILCLIAAFEIRQMMGRNRRKKRDGNGNYIQSFAEKPTARG